MKQANFYTSVIFKLKIRTHNTKTREVDERNKIISNFLAVRDTS